MTIPFIVQYNNGKIQEPELDQFFFHDNAVGESGHDTSYVKHQLLLLCAHDYSYRFKGGAANLATVDLNCLLYKYETDISWVIKHVFNDSLAKIDNRLEADSLPEQGVKHLVFLARSAIGEDAKETVDHLREMGAVVQRDKTNTENSVKIDRLEADSHPERDKTNTKNSVKKKGGRQSGGACLRCSFQRHQVWRAMVFEVTFD